MNRQTFTARVDARWFWLGVVVPPVVFGWLVVRADAAAWAPGATGMVIGLAYGLPLAALGWMVTSVAGYTVEPGRLVVHRVVADRAVELGGADPRVERRRDVVWLRLGGARLALRVEDPEACRRALEAAVAVPPRGVS